MSIIVKNLKTRMFWLPGGITRCCPNPMIAASTARDNNVSGGYPLLFSSFTFVVEEEGGFSVLCLLLLLWCVLDVTPDVDWLLSSSFGVAYNVQHVLLVFGSTGWPKLRKIRIISSYGKRRLDFKGRMPIPNSLILFYLCHVFYYWSDILQCAFCPFPWNDDWHLQGSQINNQ